MPLIAPERVHQRYGRFLDPAFRQAGIDPDDVERHSIPIQTRIGKMVHVYGLRLKGAGSVERSLLFGPNGTQTVPQLGQAYALLLKSGVGVLTCEVYSHGLVSSRQTWTDPRMRDLHSTLDAFEDILTGLAGFAQQNEWVVEHPLHLWGGSMNGGTIIDYAIRYGFEKLAGIKTEDGIKPFASISLVAPRTGLSEKPTWKTEAIDNQIRRGNALLDRFPRIGEFFLEQLLGRIKVKDRQLRRELFRQRVAGVTPWTYPSPLMFQSVDFDRESLRLLADSRTFTPSVPMLWALAHKDQDHYIHVPTSVKVALQLSQTNRDRTVLLPIDSHVPHLGKGAVNFWSAMQLFWERAEAEPFAIAEQDPFVFLTEETTQPLLIEKKAGS